MPSISPPGTRAAWLRTFEQLDGFAVVQSRVGRATQAAEHLLETENVRVASAMDFVLDSANKREKVMIECIESVLLQICVGDARWRARLIAAGVSSCRA